MDSLHQLLRCNGMRVPPSGSIVDTAIKNKLRIFAYQFNDTTPCLDVRQFDFDQVIITTMEDRLLKPPRKIDRNVAWSFFVLLQTKSYN